MQKVIIVLFLFHCILVHPKKKTVPTKVKTPPLKGNHDHFYYDLPLTTDGFIRDDEFAAAADAEFLESSETFDLKKETTVKHELTTTTDEPPETTIPPGLERSDAEDFEKDDRGMENGEEMRTYLTEKGMQRVVEMVLDGATRHFIADEISRAMKGIRLADVRMLSVKGSQQGNTLVASLRVHLRTTTGLWNRATPIGNEDPNTASYELDVDLFFLFNSSHEVHVNGCSSAISRLNVSVDWHHVSSMYKFSRWLSEGPFHSKLEATVCSAFKDLVYESLVIELAELSSWPSFGELLDLDLSVNKDIYLNEKYLELRHRGTFLNDNSTYWTPFMESPLDKMVGFSVSENVLTSALRVLYNADLLRYAFSSVDLQSASFDEPFELKLTASEPPVVTTTIDGSFVIRVTGVADAFSRPLSKSKPAMATASGSISIKVKPFVRDSDVLAATVTGIAQTSISSSFESSNDWMTKELISEMADRLFPVIDALLEKGICLSQLLGVGLEQVSLQVKKRYMIISADIGLRN